MSSPRTAAGRALTWISSVTRTNEAYLTGRRLLDEALAEAEAAQQGEALRLLRDDVLPALEYGALQAKYTFDPLIRGGHAGSAADRKRSKALGIAGTPSGLTIRLTEAAEAVRRYLASLAAGGEEKA